MDIIGQPPSDQNAPGAESVPAPKGRRGPTDYVGSAGSYLYLVAALSVANAVIIVFGGDFSLIFGATSALVAAYLFDAAIAIPIAVVIGCLLGGLGFLTVKKRATWALIAALLLYMLDAAVAVWGLVIVEDGSMSLDLLAHAVVLWMMVRGIMTLRAQRATMARATGMPGMAPMPGTPGQFNSPPPPPPL